MTNREAKFMSIQKTLCLLRLTKDLMEMASNGELLQADIMAKGSILLNSGIDSLAAKLGLPVETEPFTFTNDAGETLDCAFKVIRMGDVEILQVEDAPDAED